MSQILFLDHELYQQAKKKKVCDNSPNDLQLLQPEVLDITLFRVATFKLDLYVLQYSFYHYFLCRNSFRNHQGPSPALSTIAFELSDAKF